MYGAMGGCWKVQINGRETKRECLMILINWIRTNYDENWLLIRLMMTHAGSYAVNVEICKDNL